MIELRWIRKLVPVKGREPRQQYEKMLQYRQHTHMDGFNTGLITWSDWTDVETVEE